MSSYIEKQHTRRTSNRHFYAIVALSCCALLPLTQVIAADNPDTGEQATQTEQQSAAEAQSSSEAKPESQNGKDEQQAAAAGTPEPEQAQKPEKPEQTAPEIQPENTAKQTPEERADKTIAERDKAPSAQSEASDEASNEGGTEAKSAQAPAEKHREEPSALNSALHFASAGNRLRQQAAHYRELSDQWQPIAAGKPLHAGDQGPRVAQLRKLLQLFGDHKGLPGPVSSTRDNPQYFDAGLQLAVESYQRRHGMAVTGVADEMTLRELERPPKELARLLEINAKRWDKLPDNPGQRYILVNVPDFQLYLIDKQRIILSMKTVVGKSSKRTPDLTTKLVSVVFNPTWTVPRSILLTDLLPKARNNPEAMHKRGYRVVKYGTNTTTPINDESIQSAASGKATLRQISGPGNTLGRVKFVIPNKQAIFLHDTQAQSLFEHHHRAYSHGCIRLEEPEELAYALLGRQGWDRTRVAQATTGDESVTIRVENPPKLFITYLTAWVDGLGKVHFRPDIYHRDN